MTIVFVLKALAKAALMPPLNGLLLILSAWFFRDRRWIRRMVVSGTLLLVLQSLSPVADLLLRPLERMAGMPPVSADGAQAIVVLGGGIHHDAVEYGGDSVNDLSLERARYGATLAKRFDLPVLVSGGAPDGRPGTEAGALAAVLQREFGVPVRWQEARSTDTRDQADEVKVLLDSQDIHRILLVTHAYHMPRAQRAFAAAGFEVVPAATTYFVRGPATALSWLPSTGGLRKSYLALHEWLGLAWYAGVAAWQRMHAWGVALQPTAWLPRFGAADPQASGPA